jgi:hypothetical protein
MTAVIIASPGPVFIDPNLQSIQANATVTASGSQVVTGYGAQEVTLFINVKNAPTGTLPTLQYTIQEVDPGDGATVIGTSVSSTSINAAGIQKITLLTTYGGSIKVSWAIGGTGTPTFTGVYATVVAKLAAQMVTDGVNGPAAVKAGSTSATNADPSLVVALSPNSPNPGTADATSTGALGALNAAVQVVTAGLSTAGFQLAAGSLIGTIVPEVSFDGGTTWNATYFDTPANGKVSSIVFGTANTATAATIVGVGGSGISRVRVSAYTSGTANITVRATTRLDPSVLFAGPLGVAVPPSSAFVGGYDGTNLIGMRMKAASTAAVAADPSLVVALSPNTHPTAPSDLQASGSLAALGASLSINTQGASTLTFNVTGTWVGTILVEVSLDNGVTFPGTLTAFNLNAFFPGGITANGFYYVAVGGITTIRLYMNAYTSGTASIEANAAVGTQYVHTLSYTTDGSNVAAVAASSTAAAAAQPALVTALSPSSPIPTEITATSYPDQGNYDTGVAGISYQDAFGNLQVRGPVLTDEGSFRDDFSGTGLTTALTGTVTFTNGSTAVTGSGTSFQTQIRQGQYIKKTADPESDYVQVLSVDSQTALTLVSNYAGTTGGAASVVSNWQTVTPSGGSIAVASSIMTLTCGTTASATGSLRSLGDYLPYSIQFYLAVSQRIANQTIYFGVQDVVGAPNQQATVQLSGTTNTTGNFVTSFDNGSSIQTTAFTYPNGSNSSTYHTYKIDLSSNQATLSIDGVVVATNTIHLPAPYTDLYIDVGVINGGTAPVSSTTITVDYVFFENIDRVQIDDDFAGEPLTVQGILGGIALPENLTQVGGVNVPTNLGLIPVDLTQAETVFKQVVVSGRLPQIELSFNLVGPASLLTSTLTGTGTVAGPTAGVGTFSTGTGTTGRSLGVSFYSIAYSPHEEIYAAFTAAFTAGTAGTYQRIGLYNATDGFSFGYNGTTFGLWTRYNGTDTFVAQTSWNTDTLSGATTSKFTRNGTPEALIQTDINLYRVRFGWLGIAPVLFEVLSADGNFIVVHVVRFPNSQTTVSITNPYLPMTVDVNNNSTGVTSLTLTTGCWVAGTSASPVVSGSLIGPITVINSNGNTGAATAGSSIMTPTAGLGALGIGISGTWTGTLTFQYSMDGNLWFNDTVYNSSTGAYISSVTANGNFEAAIGAYRAYRVVATAAMTGTAFVTANGGTAPSIINTLTALTDGSNNGPANLVPANNGQYGLGIYEIQDIRPTYFITLQGFATGAVNTDVFNLIGSATKVVRVTRVRFSMTATTAVGINLQLIKRSTANAGGSTGVAVNGAYDSNDPAATATNLAYTANATTLGTVVGTAVRSDKYAVEVGTTPATQQPQVIEWIFGQNNCKPPVLRGVAQSLCVNLGGATIAGGSVSILFEWTEDNN